MNYFCENISQSVLEWMLVVLLLVLSITAIIIFSRKGVLRFQLRRLLKVMFVEYLVLLFCSTVVFREDASNTYVRLMPFKGYFTGDMRLFIDALLNVAIFIPIGFCSSVFLRFPKWLKILLLSVSLSCTIEISQYILSRGCCDTNDVMNNAIGGMIGYCIYRLWRMIRG